MKKQITIVISIIMVLTMLGGLTACGSKEVTLNSKTVNGITLDIPSDFGEFADKSGIQMASNEDSTATIAITANIDANGYTAESFDQDTYQQTQMSTYTDVTFEEYDNDATFAGSSALFAHAKGTTSKGVELQVYNYMIFFDDGTFQSIVFSFAEGGENSLKTNIDSIISNAKFA